LWKQLGYQLLFRKAVPARAGLQASFDLCQAGCKSRTTTAPCIQGLLEPGPLFAFISVNSNEEYFGSITVSSAQARLPAPGLSERIPQRGVYNTVSFAIHISSHVAESGTYEINHDAQGTVWGDIFMFSLSQSATASSIGEGQVTISLGGDAGGEETRRTANTGDDDGRTKHSQLSITAFLALLCFSCETRLLDKWLMLWEPHHSS
jgi:hypothetical protein